MKIFFKNIFPFAKKAEVLFDKIKRISDLSNEEGKVHQELDKLEYDMTLDQKEDMYISLTDFMSLMDKDDLTLADINNSCRHIDDLRGKSSVVEIYSIAEEDHIVLCRDPKNCERHKDYKGNMLRISTIRVSR